ncbi:metalloregulator ArsR/SmtB family transcription factor [bacterium]|nr:metalloregulator ArsR/SmtB family transcription factor [bacterium]
MQNQNVMLDHVFHALSDPTRRAVLERLSRGPASVSILAEPFKMALPSFMQHLEVLEHSGLLQTTKKGRVRTCQLAPKSLDLAEHWMTKQRAIWEKRLDQFDDYARKFHKKEKQHAR